MAFPRSTACLKRLMMTQSRAGMHMLESILPIPLCTLDTRGYQTGVTSPSDACHPDHSGNERFWESRMPLGAHSRSISTGSSQASPTGDGTTPFQRALQHPSAEFGPDASASNIPEAENEEPEGHEEGEEDASAQELRGRILKAAMGHVKAKGWSMAALQSGAQDLQLSRSASGMISNGAAGLVEYFVEECNQQLAAELESRQEELACMRVPERVRMAVRMRLEMLIPYIDTWPQALGIQAHPAHVATAVRQRAELVDDIWHACGDSSTDYNWYTKRGLLAAVYGATELFMITDYSPGYADTWRCLDRRLADVKRLGGAATEVRQAMSSLLASVGSMAEWAQDAVVQAQKRRQRS